MGPMLSLIPLHIQLPSKEPVLTVLQSLQDLSTRMLKYELFSEDHFRKRGAAPDEIRFNWLPLGSDLSSRVVRFTTDDDKASLRVVREQTPNPPGSWGCYIKIYDNGDHLKIMAKFDDQLLEIALLEKLLDLFTAKLGRFCTGQDLCVESLMV